MPLSNCPKPHARTSALALAFLGSSLIFLSACHSQRPANNTSHRSETVQSEMTEEQTDQAMAASVLWADNFQGDWQSNWQIQAKGKWGEENFEVMGDRDNRFARLLRVHYPAGSASPKVSRNQDSPSGGGQFYGTLGIPPQDRLKLSYNLRFPEDFDFVRGGKLPGLYGGKGASGGNIPNGRDGFSTRLMWRAGGAGEVYAYLPTSEAYGTSLGRGSWHFRPGQWHHIEQEVQLNQPGQKDGWVRIWMDGRLVLEQKNLVFRTTPELKLNGVFFSTFFGGGDRSWATPQDTHIDFADFQVSKISKTP